MKSNIINQNFVFQATEVGLEYLFYWQNLYSPYSNNIANNWQPFDRYNQLYLNQKLKEMMINPNFYTFNLLIPANDCAVNLKKLILYDFDSYSLRILRYEKINKTNDDQIKKEINKTFHNEIMKTMGNEIKNDDLEYIKLIESRKKKISNGGKKKTDKITKMNINTSIKPDLINLKINQDKNDDYQLIEMETKNHAQNLYPNQQIQIEVKTIEQNKDIYPYPNENYNNIEKEIIDMPINPVVNINIKEESINLSDLRPENEEEFIFFVKNSNYNPMDELKQANWTPYEQEDQFLLKEFYQEYINDKKNNIFKLKSSPENYIDFSQMVQKSYKNETEFKPIKRCNPHSINNNLTMNKNIQSKISEMNLIENITLNKTEFISFFKTLGNDNLKKSKKIFFKIFTEFTCEIEIEEKLCMFDNDSIIKFPLKEIKTILIEEIINLGKIDNHYLKSSLQNIYLSHISDILDYKSFFEKIISIYSMKGYMNEKLNEFLRNIDKLSLGIVKYFYVCLLASMQYFGLKCQIKNNNDLVGYRKSICSQEEFNEYQEKYHSNVIVNFKEFLTLSLKPDLASHSFLNNDFNDQNKIEFLWEITIPKEIIKNEAINFADISQICESSNEKKILVRNGAIIQIDKIIPFTENKGDQIIEMKNKYKKICTIKSFTLSTFLKFVTLNPLIKSIDLSNIELGKNEKKMQQLQFSLENNNSIKTLFLGKNKLGENAKNMLYIKEILNRNNSIEALFLYNNKLGKYTSDIEYLREVLEKTISIKNLHLSYNKIGENEKNMLIMKEALQLNNSINQLFLGNNGLGKYETNMIYLKDVLIKKNTIQVLSLEINGLGKNERNMLHLKEFLINCNSIKKLYLQENVLGKNEKNMLYLKEALELNNSIETLNLSSNCLGDNEKNVLYLIEVIENNKTIKEMILEDNNLGRNEKIIPFLKDAIGKNNTIQKLNLKENNLGENFKYNQKFFSNVKTK